MYDGSVQYAFKGHDSHTDKYSVKEVIAQNVRWLPKTVVDIKKLDNSCQVAQFKDYNSLQRSKKLPKG